MFNYLLSCKVCDLQYVGSTTNKFRLRWNNYEENDRKALRGEEHMPPELFKHFAADSHNCFLTDWHYTDWQNWWFKSHEKRRVLEKGFENCSSLWVKYLKLIVTSARFLYISPRQEYSSCKMYILKIILVCFVKNLMFVFWAVQ